MARNGLRGEGDPETYPKEFVEVTVEDNGCGMDEETAAKAVDPFFTTKAEGHGTGLGLSGVAMFVSDIGGAMRIASEPAVGTAVTLLLPREQGSLDRSR